MTTPSQCSRTYIMRFPGLRSVSFASEGFEERELLLLYMSKRDGVDRLEVRRVRKERDQQQFWRAGVSQGRGGRYRELAEGA